MSGVTQLALPTGLRHATPGDYAVLLWNGYRVAPDGPVRHDSTWALEVQRRRFAFIQWTCWDRACDRLATWQQTYWGCSSPWCGKHPDHPGHPTGGARWCLRHARERGLTREGITEGPDRRGLRPLP